MVFYKKQQGIAIPAVLLVLILIPLFGFAFYSIAMTEMRQVFFSESRVQSYYLTKSATEAMKAYLLEEPTETEGRILALLAAEESMNVSLEIDGVSEDIPVTIRVYEDDYGVAFESVSDKGGAISRTILYCYRLPDLIAVGNSGEILFFNGRTWFRPVSGVNTNLNSIAWNGLHFVAVGDNGTIITSNDGAIWETQNSGISSNLNGVTTNGQYFVAVGASGTVISSSDGITWEDYSSGAPSNALFRDVAWGNNVFVASSQVGNAGRVYTSTSQSGGNWSQTYTFTGDVLTGVYWSSTGNRFYIAGSYGSRGQILYSSSGDSWTWELNTSSTLNDVSCSHHGYIAVGDNGWVWHSENGTDWDANNLDDVSEHINSIAWHTFSPYSTITDDSFWAVGDDDSRISFGYRIDEDDTLYVYEVSFANLSYLNDIISMTPYQEGAWRFSLR